MPFSAQVVRRARARLAQEKADKESLYNRNLAEAYRSVPRLTEIDMDLRKSMVLAAQTVFTQGQEARNAMEQVRIANQALQKERAALVAANFPADFLDETPICENCGGNGYIGSTMCRCLEKLCLQEQRLEIASLTSGAERFDTFRLDYYSANPDSRYGASPRMIMGKVFDYCQRYAENFSYGSGNLLFVGNTGLGKTFLSACIANEVAMQGYSVAYESAPHLIANMEKARFESDMDGREQAQKYAECDLLIIDDLGTEMPGNFVTAALYSLINDRLLKGKSMIISTNLNIEEIAQRYSPQIASRLQGGFKGLTFVGEDIRVLKSRGALV